MGRAATYGPTTRFFTQHILEMYGAVHWTAISRYVLVGPLLGRLADSVARLRD